MNTKTSIAANALHEAEIPVGAHLVTPRRGYTHHGIHVGKGEVVHYMGLSSALRRGPIAKVTLAQFAAGHPVSIQPEACAAYSPAEIAARACARLGEDRYSVLANNCEHFCSWCAHGVNRSPQVERIVALPRRIARAALQGLAAPFAAFERAQAA